MLKIYFYYFFILKYATDAYLLFTRTFLQRVMLEVDDYWCQLITTINKHQHQGRSL